MTETRPWGSYTILEESDTHKVKRITVNPGQRLSYQMHHKRSEHWIVVAGTAEVTFNDEVHTLTYGQNIHLPVEAKHRMKNPSDKPLEFIEVQYGSYFGEDDIVRFDDDYER